MDRKEEHLHLARQQHKKNLVNDFDEIRFYHENFPTINVSQVDLTTSFFKQNFSMPIFINAMTGGTLKATEINGYLGTLAKEFNIPLALGSFSKALKDPDLLPTYQIARKNNPTGFIWGNLSADVSLETVEKALELMDFNGFQLHLNLPQEIVMPEGDRVFSNWLENIRIIKDALNIPLMVKETGFGMGEQTYELLLQAGVDFVDVGGRGGTSFTKIENSRLKNHPFAYLDDFGQSTVESLLTAGPFLEKMEFSATGGIRNPYDAVKALSLGAKSVGIVGALLPTLMEKGLTGGESFMASFKDQLQLLYTLLGCQKILDLQQKDLLFSEKLLSFMKQRNISYETYTQRKKNQL